MSAILDKLEVEDLPQGLQQVAEIIGVSKTKELIVKLAGSVVYFPKTLNSNYHKKYIKDNFNGGNHKQLADHLGLTTRSVYRLLK